MRLPLSAASRTAQTALQQSVTAAPSALSRKSVAKAERPEASPYQPFQTPRPMPRVMKAEYRP